MNSSFTVQKKYQQKNTFTLQLTGWKGLYEISRKNAALYMKK